VAAGVADLTTKETTTMTATREFNEEIRRESLENLADDLRNACPGFEVYDVAVVQPFGDEPMKLVAPVLPSDGRCAHCRCGTATVRGAVGFEGFMVVIAGEDRRDGARSVVLADAASVLEFVRLQGWSWCVLEDEPTDELRADDPLRSLVEGLVAVFENRRDTAHAQRGFDEAENDGERRAYECVVEELQRVLSGAAAPLTYDDASAWVTPHMLREVAIRIERDENADADPDEVSDETVAAVTRWWRDEVEGCSMDWDRYGEQFVSILERGYTTFIMGGEG
jgi:hypothetical protein